MPSVVEVVELEVAEDVEVAAVVLEVANEVVVASALETGDKPVPVALADVLRESDAEDVVA